VSGEGKTRCPSVQLFHHIEDSLHQFLGQLDASTRSSRVARGSGLFFMHETDTPQQRQVISHGPGSPPLAASLQFAKVLQESGICIVQGKTNVTPHFLHTEKSLCETQPGHHHRPPRHPGHRANAIAVTQSNQFPQVFVTQGDAASYSHYSQPPIKRILTSGPPRKRQAGIWRPQPL
jgi:hypothetical protein